MDKDSSEVMKTDSDREYDDAEDFFSDDDDQVPEPSKFRVKPKLFKSTKRGIEEEPEQAECITKRKCCNRRCFDILETISCNTKESLKHKFSNLKLIERKNILLVHLQNTSDVYIENFEDNNNFYFFEQSMICPKAYSEVTGISKHVLLSVRDDFNNGRTALYEHGNSGKGRKTLAGSNCVAWILNFAKKYAQDSPDEKLVILPKIFIVSELYEIYKEELRSKLVSKNGFFYLFKKNFGPRRENEDLPRIRISQYSSHARCDECVKLQEARKMVRCTADLEEVRNRTEAHRQEYGGARMEIDRLFLLCSTYPKDYLGNPLIKQFFYGIGLELLPGASQSHHLSS